MNTPEETPNMDKRIADAVERAAEAAWCIARRHANSLDSARYTRAIRDEMSAAVAEIRSEWKDTEREYRKARADANRINLDYRRQRKVLMALTIHARDAIPWVGDTPKHSGIVENLRSAVVMAAEQLPECTAEPKRNRLTQSQRRRLGQRRLQELADK